MSKVLQVTDLTKAYDPFLLDSISFSLDSGYIMGLIGPNGAGKTTIIKLLLNLITADSGRIELFGKELPGNEVEVKEKIGFVFDTPPWYGFLTSREMSSVVAPHYKGWSQDRYEAYTQDFGIEQDKRIEHLSKGMVMKYSLALALSHGAELIIMDEPTSGLDPVFRSEILELFQGCVAQENISILFSSHIVSDLEKIADYITLINNGTVTFSLSTEQVREAYCLVHGAANLLDRDTQKLLEVITRKEMHFTALSRREQELRKVFQDQIRRGELKIENPNLEDIMVLTVKGENYV